MTQCWGFFIINSTKKGLDNQSRRDVGDVYKAGVHELDQKPQGLHINVGDDAVLGVLHHQFHKEGASCSKDHLVDINGLVATLQLIVGELAGLEHRQQGGDGVLEQHGLLFRQLVLLNLVCLCLIGPTTDGASNSSC